jgi:hypothetical protein
MTKKAMSKAEKVALKKWENLPAKDKRKILENVYCKSCVSSVEMVKYKAVLEGVVVVLWGKCKMCGHEVARVLE